MFADVSVHSVFSIFIGGVRRNKEQTQHSETSANKIQKPGNHPKKEYKETVFVLACVGSSHIEQ